MKVIFDRECIKNMCKACAAETLETPGPGKFVAKFRWWSWSVVCTFVPDKPEALHEPRYDILGFFQRREQARAKRTSTRQ
jgi:hypothetical protein